MNFFNLAPIPKSWLYAAFGVKLMAALVLILIYTYYYTARIDADIFKYFDDAKAFYNLFLESPTKFWNAFSENIHTVSEADYYRENINFWERQNDDWIFNDNKTIISIVLLFLFISFGTYAPLVIVFCFLAFVGIVGIYRFFESRMSDKRIILFALLFFLPSLLIWTSGLLKESVVVAMLGLFLYYLDNFKKNKITGGLFIILSFGILCLLKYYIILSLFPGVIVYLWQKKNTSVSLLKKSLIVFGGLVVFIVLNHYVLHIYPLLDAIALKHNNFVEWVETIGNVGSYVKDHFITADFISIIKIIPQALFNVFLRPLPWEISNIMMVIPAMEGILLVFLIVYMSLNRAKNMAFDAFIVLNMSFVLILFTLSGIVCPVIGALVRYKAPALPFLYATILYFTNYSKFNFLTLKKS